jgi:hypothetical protein
MLSTTYLMLRSARRARLEAPTISMQPPFPFFRRCDEDGWTILGPMPSIPFEHPGMESETGERWARCEATSPPVGAAGEKR